MVGTSADAGHVGSQAAMRVSERPPAGATADAAAPWQASPAQLRLLRRLFGRDDLYTDDQWLVVGRRRYPVVDGVVVLLEPERWPPGLRERANHDLGAQGPTEAPGAFDESIQHSFGAEWQSFDRILSEHEKEFDDYFDLVDLESLENSVVADLGCGMGRWSYLIAPRVSQLVLVDFSEAIFVAAANVRPVAPDALFFMGDITALPFAPNACDFAFSLGVLHHLPIDALDAIRLVAPLAPDWLFYLYYDLDNRPPHYRTLLRMVTAARVRLSRIRNESVRTSVAGALAIGVYKPLVGLGHVLAPFGLRSAIPLAESYRGKSIKRLRQDAYDRFFTTIENRYSRKQIETLADAFGGGIQISDGLPYWHFRCQRSDAPQPKG